jgi:O-antigen/teichoic acid export membrane protein
MRQSHLVLSNAAIMWAARVLLLVPQLILVPFLIHTIGDAGYGVYALIWSLMVSIDQVQNALQSGVVKYSAAFLVKHDIDEVNKVVSSSFVYSILLGVLACAGSSLAAVFFHDPSGKVASSLLVVGVTILLTIPLTPYIAVIQSRQRYYVGAVAETVSKYFGLLAVFIWFRAVGPSVEAPIIIMAGMLFLSRLAQVPVAYRLVPGLHNHPRSFGWRSFRLITSFGLVVILLALCMVANSTGVRWMMGALVSTTFVAHLAIILMPALLLSQIVEAVTITVMPATSAYEAAGNRKMLQELLLRGTRYTTIIVLAGLLAAGLLMRVALVLWVGPEYTFLAPYALVLFASVSFMLSASTAHHMLKGLGKLWSILFIYLIGLVIVPISSILAVFAVGHNPYIAVTSGLAIGHLVCGVLQIRLGFRTVHSEPRDLVMRGYAHPLVVAAIVGPLAVGTITHFGIEGVGGRLVVSVFAVLLFLAGIYAFIATAEERRQFKELVQMARNRVVRT